MIFFGKNFIPQNFVYKDISFRLLLNLFLFLIMYVMNVESKMYTDANNMNIAFIFLQNFVY